MQGIVKLDDRIRPPEQGVQNSAIARSWLLKRRNESQRSCDRCHPQNALSINDKQGEIN
ncbi:MAG: hypothetical protein AAGE59_25225 [Cyanobacteria bacterium P01_F01_bin.86]